jgi:hypothetical protein
MASQQAALSNVPEETEFRVKGEMALAMIYHQRCEGLRFAYTAFDHAVWPWAMRITVICRGCSQLLTMSGKSFWSRCMRTRRSI